MALPRRFLIASAASLTALVALAGPAFAHADASAKAEQAGRTAGARLAKGPPSLMAR